MFRICLIKDKHKEVNLIKGWLILKHLWDGKWTCPFNVPNIYSFIHIYYYQWCIIGLKKIWLNDHFCYFWLSGEVIFRTSGFVLLYLSGLNMTEGILTKNNWLRFPPKPKEAKLKIMGGDFIWSKEQDADPMIY